MAEYTENCGEGDGEEKVLLVVSCEKRDERIIPARTGRSPLKKGLSRRGLLKSPCSDGNPSEAEGSVPCWEENDKR